MSDSRKIPIYHLASHARAGETLCLKLLNAHSRIHVPQQITHYESASSKELLRTIMKDEIQSIDLTSSYAKDAMLTSNSIILIKQGVWAPSKFAGFGLIRNPYSFVHSMLEYNRKEGLDTGYTLRGKYKKTYERLMRWSRKMDKGICKKIGRNRNPINALCIFYNHRINWILENTELVHRYEDLVNEPESTLGTMCAYLGVPFESKLLSAHQSYSHEAGHGMNTLGRAIDKDSLNKWRALDPKELEKISSLTQKTQKNAGYDLYR